MPLQTNWGVQAISVGWLIALVVLLVVIVLAVTGQLDTKLAFLIGGLAAARLV
jgi:hypothetical protein